MKDRLNTGPYFLPRLQGIVVPAATADIMVTHAVPKQKSKQKHSLGIAIYLVWTDRQGSNLLSDF
jgi:hypothetical protein